MKKLTYILATLAVVLGLASCGKDDIGGTATEAVAGDWYVSAVQLDDNGNVADADPFGFGSQRFHLLTYNTSSNRSDTLFVDDEGNLGDFGMDFKSKVPLNLAEASFGSADSVYNYREGNKVVISDGKILYKAGHQNNGSVADSITFKLAVGGYIFRISGIRYSGLAEND